MSGTDYLGLNLGVGVRSHPGGIRAISSWLALAGILQLFSIEEALP
jgi:hypothetical protein